MDNLALIIAQAINRLHITGVTQSHDGDFYNSCAYESLECEDLTEYLCDKGFTYIGGGHFSLAFSHPDEPQKVYKVGLKGTSDGWIQWASYSLKHQGEALIPVIHDVTFLNDEVFVATLEKVRTRSAWTDKQHSLFDAMNTYVNGGWRRENYKNWLNNSFVKDTYNSIKVQRRWALEYHREMKRITVLKAPLSKLCDEGLLGDTHEDNVGFNDKNHMILIDPLAWCYGDTDTSLFNYQKVA